MSKLSRSSLLSQKYLQRQTNPRLAQVLANTTSCAMCRPICVRTILQIASRGWLRIARYSVLWRANLAHRYRSWCQPRCRVEIRA
ncbi:hypothetical protein D3C77_549020 [compost metagenome]